MHFKALYSGILVLLLGSTLGATASAQDVVHQEVNEGWSRHPATDAAMTARLGSAASQYRQYAPIPRIALYNIGYPSSPAEYARLNGYAAVVVTTVAQDSAELPLGRLYFRDAAGKETDLPRVVYACGRLVPADSLVAATFGAHRCDALYFFPAVFAATPGELLADFSIRRRAFRLAQFTRTVAPSLEKLPLGPPGAPPSLAAASPFLVREFPAFARLLQPK